MTRTYSTNQKRTLFSLMKKDTHGDKGTETENACYHHECICIQSTSALVRHFFPVLSVVVLFFFVQEKHPDSVKTSDK